MYVVNTKALVSANCSKLLPTPDIDPLRIHHACTTWIGFHQMRWYFNSKPTYYAQSKPAEDPLAAMRTSYASPIRTQCHRLPEM